MYCPKCRVERSGQAQFCTVCGTRLVPHEPPAAGQTPPPAQFCRRCGKPCPPGTTLCGDCRSRQRVAVLLRVACAVLSLALCAALAIWITDPFDWNRAALSLSLTVHDLSIAQGETETLTAVLAPDGGEEVSVRWTSSDPSVAEVESTGALTAQVRWTGEGSCTITASAQDGGTGGQAVTDACLVTCEAPEEIATLTLDTQSLSLEEGGSAPLTALLEWDAAGDGSYTVEWSSSDETVASVTKTEDALTAQVNWTGEGTCVVTATVSGGAEAPELSANCVVTCAAPAAPEVSFPVGTVEYNGHHYLVCMEETDWESAQAACEAMGGHLATITSAEENEFVYQLACTYSREKAFLLGGTDRDQEGTFVWVTGEPFEYTNWGYLNQPDNYREYKDQDYITLLTFDQTGEYHDDSGEWWGTHASEWDDKDGQSNPYICEWDY